MLDFTHQRRLLGLFATCFTAFHARDLPSSWNTSSFNEGCWLAFLIWVGSLLFARISATTQNPTPRLTSFLLVMAISLSLASQMTELRVVGHFGFAMALVAVLHNRTRDLALIGFAASWMPATGYFLSWVSGVDIPLLRLLFAGAGAALVLFPRFPVILPQPFTQS